MIPNLRYPPTWAIPLFCPWCWSSPIFKPKVSFRIPEDAV